MIPKNQNNITTHDVVQNNILQIMAYLPSAP